MHALLRRLIVASVRRLLPEAFPDEPSTGLALRPGALLATVNVPQQPTDGSQPPLIYAPPAAPVQPVYAPPHRRRRRTVAVTETIYIEKTGGLYE